MKRALFIACLFLCSVSALAAETVNPVQYLTAQNYRVLSGRIHKMLEFRLSTLGACPAETATTLQTRYQKLPAYTDKRDIVLETLSLYYDSYKVPEACKRQLDLNENVFAKAERKKFSALHRLVEKACRPEYGSSDDKVCRRKFQKVIADLDPHCVSLQVPNTSGEYDSFPCMAADHLVGKTLVSEQNWNSFLERTDAFLHALRRAFQDPRAKENGVDLWSAFLRDGDDSPQVREEFLALLNFFFSSFHSASSYIRGFHDHIWRFLLLKTGSPERTLEDFVASRLKVDEFRAIHTWAQGNRYALSFDGIPMADKIRHDYMSAYLACRYRDEGKAFHKGLPVLLGFAYETYDFKSHFVDEKLGFKISRENFRVDTRRYRTGTVWGLRFCRGQ